MWLVRFCIIQKSEHEVGCFQFHFVLRFSLAFSLLPGCRAPCPPAAVRITAEPPVAAKVSSVPDQCLGLSLLQAGMQISLQEVSLTCMACTPAREPKLAAFQKWGCSGRYAQYNFNPVGWGTSGKWIFVAYTLCSSTQTCLGAGFRLRSQLPHIHCNWYLSLVSLNWEWPAVLQSYFWLYYRHTFYPHTIGIFVIDTLHRWGKTI